jgi:hypothetical protein
MGYLSTLHLVDVRIKQESVAEVAQALAAGAEAADEEDYGFFSRAVLDEDRFLAFSASDDDDDGYVPDEEDGTVPALSGKWYDAEEIAAWLKLNVEGGSIILHSEEADGAAWGWEFDGAGKMRELQLAAVGEWE